MGRVTSGYARLVPLLSVPGSPTRHGSPSVFVCFRSEGKQFLKQQTLDDVEAVLDPAQFVRIHRSYILNIDRLAKLELYAKDRSRRHPSRWLAVAGEPLWVCAVKRCIKIAHEILPISSPRATSVTMPLTRCSRSLSSVRAASRRHAAQRRPGSGLRSLAAIHLPEAPEKSSTASASPLDLHGCRPPPLNPLPIWNGPERTPHG